MKIGDKLLCKKSLIGTNHHLSKGEWYKINDIQISNTIFYIIKGHTCQLKFGGTSWKLEDHFYTIQEARKLKLEKIKTAYE